MLSKGLTEFATHIGSSDDTERVIRAGSGIGPIEYGGIRPLLSDLKTQGWWRDNDQTVTETKDRGPWADEKEGQFALQVSDFVSKSNGCIQKLWNIDLKFNQELSTTEKMFGMWSWADPYDSGDFMFQILSAYISETGARGAALLVFLHECGAVKFSRIHRQDRIIDFVVAILMSPRRVVVADAPFPKAPATASAGKQRLVINLQTLKYTTTVS